MESSRSSSWLSGLLGELSVFTKCGSVFVGDCVNGDGAIGDRINGDGVIGDVIGDVVIGDSAFANGDCDTGVKCVVFCSLTTSPSVPSSSSTTDSFLGDGVGDDFREFLGDSFGEHVIGECVCGDCTTGEYAGLHSEIESVSVVSTGNAPLMAGKPLWE